MFESRNVIDIDAVGVTLVGGGVSRGTLGFAGSGSLNLGSDLGVVKNYVRIIVAADVLGLSGGSVPDEGIELVVMSESGNDPVIFVDFMLAVGVAKELSTAIATPVFGISGFSASGCGCFMSNKIMNMSNRMFRFPNTT